MKSMYLAICCDPSSDVGASLRSGSCTITGSSPRPSFHQISRKTSTTTRRTPRVTASETVTLRMASSHRENDSKAAIAVGLGLETDGSDGATSPGIGAPRAKPQAPILGLRPPARQHAYHASAPGAPGEGVPGLP